MAKDDTLPSGLFSKMVKFVRSPGTQWNELDDQSSAKDGGLSKQALKEMIERKRRNDFVRKREFDMLRKLRRREATGGVISDAAARPSFFQSSMPSRPDDRAMTLKKIDEIEAQMSMQWWKTKHGAQAGASTANQSSDFVTSAISSNPNIPAAAAIPNTTAFARTTPDDLQNRALVNAQKPLPASELVDESSAEPKAPEQNMLTRSRSQALPIKPSAEPAQQNSSMRQPPIELTDQQSPASINPGELPNSIVVDTPLGKPVLKPSQATAPLDASLLPVLQTGGGLGGLAAAYEAYGAYGAATSFSTSKLFAIDVDDVQHDPELEEAAIRFANGDDGGAEAGLLEAISVRGPRHQHEETWLTLFDLYRATSKYDRFESLAIDFAGKFNRSSPMWFSIPEMVSKMSGSEMQEPVGLRKADWKSPANFGIQSLAALNGVLARVPMPWTLDWASLQSFDDAAVAPLTKLLLSWANQPVQLRMAHTAKLEKVLKDAAPSGVNTTNQERWNLLMAYLRVAHRPEEFEMAALDFCVTYEVSPPSWESARCEFKGLDLDGNTGIGQTIVGDVVHDSIVSELQTDAGSSTMTAQLASVELSGQIMGEPKPVLDKLEARLAGADMMVISCAKLIRVDFSAAGSLLNWVTARQSEGRIVQLIEVHRLVAAFFHVIGISEHAKVTTRID
jgi:ABC-type transporter Mla MlaB component